MTRKCEVTGTGYKSGREDKPKPMSNTRVPHLLWFVFANECREILSLIDADKSKSDIVGGSGRGR